MCSSMHNPPQIKSNGIKSSWWNDSECQRCLKFEIDLSFMHKLGPISALIFLIFNIKSQHGVSFCCGLLFERAKKLRVFLPWSYYSSYNLGHVPPRCSHNLCSLCGLARSIFWSHGQRGSKKMGFFFIHWHIARYCKLRSDGGPLFYP